MMTTSAAERSGVAQLADRARRAARMLSRLDGSERAALVAAAADGLERHASAIVAGNASDLAAARELQAAGVMSQALLQRLALDAGKLRGVIAGMRQVAALGDPVGRVTLATDLDDGLRLERVTCPIGVIGVIFEARPDALPQIVSLALKSGNAVLLKGGHEARATNEALVAAINGALAAAGAPEGAVTLLQGREDVTALLAAHGDVDLIVPRGSAELVRHIQASTRIPVLGHADGRCHLYVDRAADLQQAIDIAVDAKAQYPAACNSIETMLVHRAVADAFLPAAGAALRGHQVALRGDERARAILPDVAPASREDWDTEYGDLVLNLRVVDSLDQALEHIARHGSRHTEAIVTSDQAAARLFCAEVDAAGVFVNASTRFADGFRYGFGAEVGISTGKVHPRGPVGLDGLVTYKYQLSGQGHTVAPYARGERRFTHRPVARPA